MRLFVTRPSPYARKAWSAVHELGLLDQVAIEELPARMPQVPKPDLEAVNPLGKVPVLDVGHGAFIADSPVIVAYLNEQADGDLVPRGGRRWTALTLEALADGCMDAGVVLRVEQLKPAERRDPGEIAAYSDKIGRTLDLVDADPRWIDGPFDVGQLALACAIDWLIFRELVPDPLSSRPRLAAFMEQASARPALAATAPQAS